MSKKLIFNSKNHHGKLMSIPIDGEVELGDDGSVVVSDEAAKILLTIEGWSDTKTPGLEGEADGEETSGLEGEADLKWLEGLNLDELAKLNLEDLTEIAEVGKIKGYEKFGKNKKALATYIKSQLNKKKK